MNCYNSYVLDDYNKTEEILEFKCEKEDAKACAVEVIVNFQFFIVKDDIWKRRGTCTQLTKTVKILVVFRF